ncbi:ADAM family of metalloprotease-like protein ADM-B [Pseudomassariella vexata]|uniref:Disintegrin and metalloproteinase domain-containing protein B n=1 Tax=Pseudomassariella vexata TaxID=1141098 RepID=A0A1Y2D9W4_9PEZI|nr:ADAM family of metalloprotease-like protein ADM-B [Pseudomassariella vexata]ORY56053.1 ADAM family of metalloprotease-like protein ADM-B [Pseudomassariella vexata]
MRGILNTAVAFLLILSHSAQAHSVRRNALNYISRVDEPVLHSPSHRVHAYSTFDATFLLHNKQDKVRLSLQPNHDVLSETATVKYLSADGTLRREEVITRSDHKVFKGDAFVQHTGSSEWVNAGWARITVYRDGLHPIFEGAFRIDGNHHHVQTSTNYRRTQHHDDPVVDFAEDEYMVVWRDSDVTPNPHDFHEELRRDFGGVSTCSSDGLNFNLENNHPVYKGLDLRDTAVGARSLFGRQIDDGTTGGNGAGVNLTSTIGSTNGCPTTRKVALVGIATDCTYTAEFNSTSSVRSNIITQVNSASALYESTFNISLGIQNLTISDATCPGTAPSTNPWNVDCSDSVTITDRLNLFSAWRGQYNDTNAYWTLLSTCNTDAAVGLAWLGQVCTTGSQTSGSSDGNETIAGANVVVRTSTEWQVFAHETGHTFGAVHDCTSSTCSDGTASVQKCCPVSASSCDAQGAYIMNPSTGSGITNFSPCSIGNICSAMDRNSIKTQCLTNNRDVVTITGQQCGNGIVEAGEDCDCGGESGCNDNACCNPTTCKFQSGAVCDPSNEDCCNDTCQFASNGTVCRSSTGTCDPQEVCSGSSAVCPADVTTPDGESCGASGADLTCASGQCTSRDLQCKTLMGSLSSNNDTYACNSQGCLLSCASSSLAANTCYNMNQYFLDGTPCQGGGKCSNGQCEGSTVANEVGSWISDNKNIVIPVASVVGGLIVVAILSCCITSCRRRRARKNMKPTKHSGNYGDNAWNAANVARPAAVARGPPPGYSPYHEQQQWGHRPRVPITRYA